MLDFLKIRVPLWVALILASTVIYFVLRPEPPPITTIEYRDYWKPPLVRRTLPPTNLVQYTPVPTAELRTDTIKVPVHLTDYQLWQPSQVETRRNAVVIRSFDTVTLSYRDYYYEPTRAKFGANLELSAMVNAFTFEPQFELQGLLRYNRLGVFGRVGVVLDEPYALVGVRYSVF